MVVEDHALAAEGVAGTVEVEHEVVAGSSALLECHRHAFPVALADPPEAAGGADAQLGNGAAVVAVEVAHHAVEMGGEGQHGARSHSGKELVAVAGHGEGDVHHQHYQA